MSSSGFDNNNSHHNVNHNLIRKRSPNRNVGLNPASLDNSNVSASSRPSSGSSEKMLFNKNNLQLMSNNRKNLNSKILSKPSIIHSSVNSNLNGMGILAPRKNESKSRSNSPPKPIHINEDEDIPEKDDLTITLLSRLKKLEQTCSEQKILLTSRESTIKDLQDVIHKQKIQIEKQKKDLDQQQSTMNTMLRVLDDHDIKHPFNSSYKPVKNNTSSITPEVAVPSSVTPPQITDDDMGPHINMKLLEQRVQALNKMIDDEELMEVSKTNSNVKQLKQKPVSIVTFWKNGIVVDNGPFKPYKWQITKAFLTDILDGYFPYEFKEKHPDGVKLKIVDKTSEPFSKTVERSIGKSNYLKDNNSNIVSLDYLKYVEENGKPNAPLDKEKFLNLLPKQVVKNGKLIPIREDIEKVISGGNGDTKSSSTEKDSIVEIRDEDITTQQQVTSKDTCIIKLRSSSGQQFMVYISKHKTIRELRQLLLPYLSPNSSFRLKAIPNTFFDDESSTLETCKLYPKAILMILMQD
ncbi:hypothetical protein C9374_006638 [Naegleria lovaniensis]|uniref:UBX domain-containing protein 11 n=1 Tax=Naegleria lovaniensis TaxID=51637 RepID=A0AA88GN90_NAELO|nr:uncharacterized protein C9374_006638 [Naegleria lovaniensis]KAG2379521.1 hypothetical protein C9374_006638 [Naegleria lovaniensis]